jgi:Domain of unknown function (DUF4129)
VIAALAVVAAVVSEALAMYTLAELVASGYEEGDRRAVAAVMFVAVALIAFALPRIVEFAGFDRRRSLALMALPAYLVVFGALRIQFHSDFAIWDLSWTADFVQGAESAVAGNGPIILAFLMLATLFTRCAWRSSNEVELETLAKSVGFPFIAVTFAMVLGATSDRSGEVARAGAVYYVVALLALACAQSSLSGTTFGELRSGGTTAVMMLGTLGVTVVAALVFWIVFGVAGPTVGPPLGTAVNGILFVLLYPIAWVLDMFFQLIVGDVAPPQLVETRSRLEDANSWSREPGEDASAVGRAAGFGFRVLAIVALVAIIWLGIRWFTRLRSRSRVNAAEGEGGSLSGALREDLAGLFRGFRRKEASLRELPNSAAMQLYYGVLARASREGVVRQPGETPDELAPRLKAALDRPVTDEISEGFKEARYGDREPAAEDTADRKRRFEDGDSR